MGPGPSWWLSAWGPSLMRLTLLPFFPLLSCHQATQLQGTVYQRVTEARDMEPDKGSCLTFPTILLGLGLSCQRGPWAGCGLPRGPKASPLDMQGRVLAPAAALTSSSRAGTRKEMRSHSRAESQKVATWTPLTNWTCLAWMALSLTARMENVLARNAMAKSKLRAISNPFRPLQRVGGGQSRSYRAQCV